MWVADMDFEAPNEVKMALIERVKIGAYGYSYVPNTYFEAYKDFWLRRHQTKLETDWMIFSTGVIPALSSIVRRMTKIGENVVIMSPVYNIFYNSIRNNNRNILESELVYNNGEYSIDYIDLEKKLAMDKTTMIILCNPHNPIGKIWTRMELKKIAELCIKHNVAIVCDEIHCDIVRTGESYNSILNINKEIRDNTILLISASKCFNMAGLQSACVVIPNKDIRAKVNRGLNTDEVAENNFFGVEATVAALTKCDYWLEEMNSYVDKNMEFAYKFIERYIPTLKPVKGNATYLLWLDVSAITKNTIKLCELLEEKIGLKITPGDEYGECGAGFVRINLATSHDNVVLGMKMLKKGIELWMQ